MMVGRSTAVLSTFLLFAACAGNPEQVNYETMDAHARWLDRFREDTRACMRAGGVIVQERHTPDSIRIGNSEPEARTRYWCLQ